MVVSDPYGTQNGCGFGVSIYAFNPDRKQIHEYRWGTGNCLVSRECPIEYHQKRLKEVVTFLQETRQIFAGELRSADAFGGVVKAIDADKNTLTLTSSTAGKAATDKEYSIPADASVIADLVTLKDVVPLKERLKSDMLPGALVRLATVTDKEGKTKVTEVRVQRRAVVKK